MSKQESDLRIFGFIWAAIFGAIAFYPLLKGDEIVYWSLYVMAVFVVSAITFPAIYKITYFYQTWVRFGDIVGKLNSKVIIFVLFYFIFLPIGILLKIFRKDLLSKRINKKATSYFIDRKEQPQNMENQF